MVVGLLLVFRNSYLLVSFILVCNPFDYSNENYSLFSVYKLCFILSVCKGILSSDSTFGIRAQGTKKWMWEKARQDRLG